MSKIDFVANSAITFWTVNQISGDRKPHGSAKEMGQVNKPMSNVGFHLMKFMFKVRDFFAPRLNVLKEAKIESGFSVLDYGCGPGGYIMPLAELVGSSGKIYALDIHPCAILEVKRIASCTGIDNIQAIESDCNTGLPENCVDTVLLFDVFHDLAHPDDVLKEIHRILKPGGTLSFSDHHMKEKQIIEQVTAANMFRFIKKGKKTFSFAKAN